MNDPDDSFKAQIVRLILRGDVEEAIRKLSKYYNIPSPRIKVKYVKGRSKALAIYSLRDRTIYIHSGEYYSNPFIILHEFYHHLRSLSGRHRGTEDKANEYALSFIEAYRKVLNEE